MPDKNNLDIMEKKLVENFRGRKPVEIGNQWMQNVMESISIMKTGPRERWIDIDSLQTTILWRFSGAAAAVSVVLVIYFLISGASCGLDEALNILWDPIELLGVELLGL